MLPSVRSIAGDAYVFQQDSVPAHRARQTVELLQRETPKFIAPDLRPPNSPNLNGLSQSIVDDAVDEWQKRLRACVKEKEGISNICCNNCT